MSIHIGTSGWSYKHWKNIFYPAGLKPAQWLPYYADHFSTTEINASFYRLPAEETIGNWMSMAPKGFTFCPKMSRFLTHMKKLKDPEEPLERFFRIFELMKKMMGPVLLQLPPQLKFDYDRTEHLFHLLKTRYRAYRFALEIRHDSWLHIDSISLMTRYDMAFVIAQSGAGFPYSETVTAQNIYVRFHGPGELYASSYSTEQLRSFASKFRKWSGEGHTIWAYFNNDIHGYAVEDARRLREMVRER